MVGGFYIRLKLDGLGGGLRMKRQVSILPRVGQ
jgi:hypothetical protein